MIFFSVSESDESIINTQKNFGIQFAAFVFMLMVLFLGLVKEMAIFQKVFIYLILLYAVLEIYWGTEYWNIEKNLNFSSRKVIKEANFYLGNLKIEVFKQ